MLWSILRKPALQLFRPKHMAPPCFPLAQQIRCMANQRHKKLLKLAKGYRGRAKSCYTVAIRAVSKARQYAYIGRKVRAATSPYPFTLKKYHFAQLEYNDLCLFVLLFSLLVEEERFQNTLDPANQRWFSYLRNAILRVDSSIESVSYHFEPQGSL